MRKRRRSIDQTIEKLIILLLNCFILIVPVQAGHRPQILRDLSKLPGLASFNSRIVSFLSITDPFNKLFIIFLDILFYVFLWVLIRLLKSAFRLLSFHYLFWLSTLVFAFTRLIRCLLCAYVLYLIPNLYLEFLMFHKLVCIFFIILIPIEDNNNMTNIIKYITKYKQPK